MPAGNFKVKADSQSVTRSLQRLRDTFGDMRPVLTNAAAELTSRIRQRFANRVDPDGNRWAPWAASTAKRAAKNPFFRLMQRTRQLRDNTRYVAGTKDLRAVIGMPYGVYHEQPNGPGTGTLPRRAFLFSTRNGGRALSLADEQYLLNALRYQIRKATDQ